jgi:hypothetical protein
LYASCLLNNYKKKQIMNSAAKGNTSRQLNSATLDSAALVTEGTPVARTWTAAQSPDQLVTQAFGSTPSANSNGITHGMVYGSYGQSNHYIRGKPRPARGRLDIFFWFKS